MSNNITQENWRMTNPRPRGSVCRSRTQHGEPGSRQCLVRRNLQSQMGSKADEVLCPAGQSLQWLMPREISVAWSSALVNGTQHLSSGLKSASVIPSRVVDSTLLGLLIGVLAPFMATGEFPQEPTYELVLLCRHGYSGHLGRYLRCASCQMCLA